MQRAVAAAIRFIRYAFWPLSASILLVLLLQPIYFFSLASLDYVTSRPRIAAHLSAAFDQGVLSDDGAPSARIFRGGEQLTECISLGIGLDKTETSWVTAVTGTYPVSGSAHACQALHQAVSGVAVSGQPYFRYWHGYRLILAPLTSLFPLWAVKAINLLMLAGACALLWIALRNACDATVATVFLVTFVCLGDVWSIWRTSTHSISLAYILAGSALFAATLRKQWRGPGLIVLSAALGSGFNFLDFLVNPPMMPMLMAFFVLLSSRRESGTLALTVVLAWFLGYSETWMAKWGLANFAMPESAGVAKDILSTVGFRTIGVFDGVDLVPLAATGKAFLRSVNRIEVVVPAIFVLAIAHYAATASRLDWRRAFRLSCPVFVSILWFEALSSHTQVHLTPSSRSAVAAVAIILAAILMALQPRPSLHDLRCHLELLGTKLVRFRKKRTF